MFENVPEGIRKRYEKMLSDPSYFLGGRYTIFYTAQEASDYFYKLNPKDKSMVSILAKLKFKKISLKVQDSVGDIHNYTMLPNYISSEARKNSLSITDYFKLIKFDLPNGRDLLTSEFYKKIPYDKWAEAAVQLGFRIVLEKEE